MPSSGIQTHIDDVSRRLEDWLRGTVADVDVAFVSDFEGDDTKAKTRPRIEICFHSITDEKPDRALVNRGDVFLLTYFLRVTGPNALANQRVYSGIYFAAHDGGDFKIGGPDGRAQAGIPGRTAMEPALLTLTARLVRPAEAAAPGIVTQPLNLKLRTLGRITGKVVTDTGTPIMRAEIDARTLNKRAVSDAAGQFTILGAPATGAVSLTVSARNRSIDVLVDTAKQAEIVIVMPMENEHA